MNDQELKNLIKMKTRNFFITFDMLLQRLSQENKFMSKSFNPVVGKIDPYKVNEFNCNLKILKKEKINQIVTEALIESKLHESKSDSNVANSKDTVIHLMDITNRKFFEAIDSQYLNPKDSGTKYAKFNLFSFFKIGMSKGDLEALSEEKREIMLKIIKGDFDVMGKGVIVSEALENSQDKEVLEEILKDPKLCYSTMIFNFNDNESSLLCMFDYNMDFLGGFKRIGTIEEFYNSLSYNYGDKFDQKTVKVFEILPMNESSIHLLDI